MLQTTEPNGGYGKVPELYKGRLFVKAVYLDHPHQINYCPHNENQAKPGLNFDGVKKLVDDAEGIGTSGEHTWIISQLGFDT